MPSWPVAARSGRPSTGAATSVCPAAACRAELAHHGHAVRAHHEMDRAVAERLAQAARAERDFADDVVLDEHRDDDLAAGEIANRRGHARSGFRERLRSGRDDVEDREIVPRTENAARHPLAHPTETDKTHFHVVLQLRSSAADDSGHAAGDSGNASGENKEGAAGNADLLSPAGY
jgi:hypothetical protein